MEQLGLMPDPIEKTKLIEALLITLSQFRKQLQNTFIYVS